jgi:MYXO-CTERM domain-containing protein
MSPDPVLQAGAAVQLHLVFAVPSVVLGTLVLFLLRPGRWHRRLGHAWVVSMAGLAISGLFIPSEMPLIGPVGWLHIFSAVTLFSLWRGIVLARRGDHESHSLTFEALWFGGIGAAGVMTFIPGRTVNRAVMGSHWEQGWWVVLFGLLGLAALWAWRRRATIGAGRQITPSQPEVLRLRRGR